MISNNIIDDLYHIGHKLWVWFPVCPYKEAVLHRVSHFGAQILSAVRNQDGPLVGG